MGWESGGAAVMVRIFCENKRMFDKVKYIISITQLFPAHTFLPA